jgi:hypothetical protein
MPNLILLAYGSEKEYQMATVVVLSFYAWCNNDPDDARFIIYTDKPEYFSARLTGLPVAYCQVTPQDWEAMLHGYIFKFHRKMSIIEQTFAAYPDENVVFLDSDVFFYNDPRPMLQDISDQVSYMHVREHTLNKQITFVPAEDKNRFLDYIEHTDFTVGEGKYHFHKDDHIWNAGVIGISPAMAPRVNDVRQITEDIWRLSEMHISEQLAHTFALGALTKLKPANHFVVHYWKKKDIIEKAFAGIFNLEFTNMPMVNQLSTVKTITLHYGSNFDLICHEEEALLAMKNKNFNVGIKATVKAVLEMLHGKGTWDDNSRFLRSVAAAA